MGYFAFRARAEQSRTPSEEAGMDRTTVPASPFSSCVCAEPASINFRDQFRFGLCFSPFVEHLLCRRQFDFYGNFPSSFAAMDECL